MYGPQTKYLPVTERLLNQVDGMQSREHFVGGVGQQSESWLRVCTRKRLWLEPNCYRGTEEGSEILRRTAE
jgi:hypothetical protein